MQLLMLDPAASQRQPWISALRSSGFNLDLFEFLEDGKEAVQHIQYQVMLVDSRLPDGDCINWLRERRSTDSSTPFVVVTAAQDVESRIRAFEFGADDCVTDLLDARELVAKVRAILRRQPISRESLLYSGNVCLDIIGREVRVCGHLLTLPRRELGILEHLMLSFNRLVTREYLEGSVYGALREVCPNSIEVRISRLRRSLSQAGANVEIKTLRGIGYRLQMCGE